MSERVTKVIMNGQSLQEQLAQLEKGGRKLLTTIILYHVQIILFTLKKIKLHIY